MLPRFKTQHHPEQLRPCCTHFQKSRTSSSADSMTPLQWRRHRAYLHSYLPLPHASVFSLALRETRGPGLCLRSWSSWFVRDFVFVSSSSASSIIFTAYFYLVLQHAWRTSLKKIFTWSCHSSGHLFPNKQSTSAAFIFSRSLRACLNRPPFCLHHFSLLLIFNASFLYHIFCQLIK